MALLKYKCDACGRVFEELVFGDQKPPCPHCASENVQRHYQGKCYFGMNAKGTSSGCSGGSGSCGGSCGSCGGCH